MVTRHPRHALKWLQAIAAVLALGVALSTSTVDAISTRTVEPVPSPSVPNPVAAPSVPAPLEPVTASAPAERNIGPSNPGGPVPRLPRISGSTVRFDPSVWGVPTNGTDVRATTLGLQAAIDDAARRGIARFVIPAGTYLLGLERHATWTVGIDLPSNFELILDDDAVFQMATHDKWNACVVAVTGQTDVAIRGGTIIGDRDTHIFTRRDDGATTHDEGHLICIQNESERVLVDGVKLTRATGDGILLVGQMGPGSSVKDITIRNSEFDGNRRQGVSVVGGVRVLITSNEIHHTSGTNPQFGIDIESLDYESRDIRITHNDFHDNAGGDVVNVDGRNVLIEHNRFREGDGHANIDGPIVFWPRGDQTIRHNTIEVVNGGVNGKVGIIGYSTPDVQPRSNPALNWIYDNHCDGCGLFLYDTIGLRVMGNTFENGFIAARDVTDIVIDDNEVSHARPCTAYRLIRITGSGSGNTFEGRPVTFAFPPTGPFTLC